MEILRLWETDYLIYWISFRLKCRYYGIDKIRFSTVFVIEPFFMQINGILKPAL